MSDPVNPFDQFDQSAAAPPVAAAATANPFDQFDAPPPAPDTRPAFDWKMTPADVQHFKENTLHLAGQIAQIPANAAMGLANLVADPITYIAGKVTGTNPMQPTDAWREAKDTAFGGALAPSNSVDQWIQAIGPMVATAGASGPAADASLLNPLPNYNPGNVPSNFVSPENVAAQQRANLVEAGQSHGLVVPPATSNPTTFNRAIENLGGKIATAQESAVGNEPMFTRMAQEDLGLDTRIPIITPAALNQRAAEASAMYKPVTQIPGTVSTDSQYSDLLDALRDKYNAVTDAFPGTPKAPILKDINSVDVSDIPPGAALTKIQMLRDKATSAFNAGDTGLGRDYKALSGNLEDQLDRGIQTMPGVDPDTIANYQDGRTLAAKIHDVRDALRSDGSVDPRKLHANDEGQLTGNLKTAADWAGEFYKTSADPGKLGSVGVNKLGAMLARMTGGGIGAVAGATLGHPIIGAGVGQDLAARAQPLVEEGARWYALGPGQAGAIPDYGQAIPSTRNVATMIQMLKASKPNDPGIAQTLQLENP